MAQHIPTTAFKQKIFRKIEEGIKKDCKNMYLTGSLMYEWLKRRLRTQDYEAIKIDQNDEVFEAIRYIGKGFVWGDTKGYFEVHVNRILGLPTVIYLVA